MSGSDLSAQAVGVRRQWRRLCRLRERVMKRLSIRHAASRRLRKERRATRRHSSIRPPWRRLPERALSGGVRPGAVRLLIFLALWAGLLVGISFIGPASAGLPAATASALEVLWQVQATSVGLVFALVVFVFGLLPGGRGRLTYRQFLRRTHAVGLTLFNVGSLTFNGLVLLGVGHQIPSTDGVPGHGWALSVASVTAMISIASIVPLLAWTVRALDPAGIEAVQADYRRCLAAREVRLELRELACLSVVFDLRDSGAFDFNLPYLGSDLGRSVTTGNHNDRVIRDVSVWRLWLLVWLSSRRRRSRPVLRVWPGRPVTPTTPLITLDRSAGALARSWARCCIRTAPVSSDEITQALNAVHADTLDDIRADRPVEAVAGMKQLTDLHQTVWQAYAAHGLTYGPDIRQSFRLYRLTAGERLIGLLHDELRAAAISGDDRIRREAAVLPRRLASEAFAREAAGTIQDSLGLLLGVYAAAVSDLTQDGHRRLPDTKAARARVQAPFQSLLSFTCSNLQGAIEQAAALEMAREPTPATADVARSAHFASAQLQVAHQQMMEMVRSAISFGDIATVREALTAWKMPDLHLLHDALESSRYSGSVSQDHGGRRDDPPALLRQLGQSVDAARDRLDAMILQLLAEALAIEPAILPGDSSGRMAEEGTIQGIDAPDALAAAILDRLPTGRMWRILETVADSGIRSASPFDEARILPAGTVMISQLPDATSQTLEAFVLAAITRPNLVAGTEPSSELALADAPGLTAAIDRVLASRLPWLRRYGVPGDSAQRQGTDLKNTIAAAASNARDARDHKIRSSPVLQPTVDTARSELRSAFHDADIAGRLLAWAGCSPPAAPASPDQADGHKLSVLASVPGATSSAAAIQRASAAGSRAHWPKSSCCTFSPLQQAVPRLTRSHQPTPP